MKLPFLLLMGLLLVLTAVAQPASPKDKIKPKPKPKTPKYFKEPGGSMALAHYDARYFKDQIPYSENRIVLRDLIQSYLTVLSSRGVETWIAHGTLLGWWWNGQVMPWDYDLDVQVSNYTLSWLALNMNRTLHAYHTLDGVTKRYLLDINPHFDEVTRGDGQNIIDARWIDMQNGMFIDITAVREREPNTRPGIWSCKNKHRYLPSDLWPLRATEFEGVKAHIPFSFQKILIDEYGAKSIVAEEWAGHRWNNRIKEWVKMSEMEKQQRKDEALRRKKLDFQASQAHT